MAETDSQGRGFSRVNCEVFSVAVIKSYDESALGRKLILPHDSKGGFIMVIARMGDLGLEMGVHSAGRPKGRKLRDHIPVRLQEGKLEAA